MQPASKAKISELQSVMTKMTLEVCCVAALPEFGIRWREISRAIRNARLPMTSASVARVICRHVAKSLPSEDVEEILSRLRLKLVASQSRTWHVVRLSGREGTESAAVAATRIPSRIRQALSTGRSRTYRPEVQTVMMGDLYYISLRLVSGSREGSVLYAASPLGHDVALVSSVGAATLLKAVVKGLGYTEFEDMKLQGRDPRSLLRISDKGMNENAEHLACPPEYVPQPVLTKNGIDYTNKTYDEQYVNAIIGPDPPLLTDLNIKTSRTFFDRSRLNKQINLTVHLKSEDVAKSLKAWVVKGALAPTSDFFQIYHKMKSNKITYSREDSD